jgi:hypothetical protein
MARYGGIQGFAGLFMLALLALGFVQAGWRGMLTALLASWNAWPAIARQERITTSTPTRIERAQRLGGIIGAVLTCAGLVYGGWRHGWAWGGAGFMIGLALGFTTEAVRDVVGRLAAARHHRRPDDQVDPPPEIADTDDATPPATTRSR